MNGNKLLKKLAILSHGSSSSDLKQGVKDLFDVDPGKKGKAALKDSALGVAGVGAPAAYTVDAVAKSNVNNPDKSKSQAIRDTTKTGLETGAMDGAMLGVMHRTKDTLGHGNGSLLKRLAIYGGTTAAINGGLAAGSAATRSEFNKKDSS